jgi:hypothetical protein
VAWRCLKCNVRSLCSECETLRGDKIDLVVQVAELTGEVSKLKGLLDIRDDEIVLLKSHLAKAVEEIDQLREDIGAQSMHIREADRRRGEAEVDAAFVRSVNTKLLTENSALKASGWRQFKDQKPTMDDADPTASPAPLSQFSQWVRSLTYTQREVFSSNGNLRPVWDSIEKFNQNPEPGASRRRTT